MTVAGAYCSYCGTKIEPDSRFCSSCGRSTPLTAAQTATVTRTDSISDRRELVAWIMAFIITGTGHMVIGRVARGIAILLGAMLTGFVTFSIDLILGIISYIVYQFFQLYDLHQSIKKLRGEQPR